MNAPQDSALVNFYALQQEPSAERRGELFRNVTALLTLVTERCGNDHLDVYDGVLVRLADMVEETVRQEVARRLADLGRAPGGIIRKLAVDEIAVADPLLRQSPILTEDDLIAIAEIRGNPHRLAIAARLNLPTDVTDVLVERGDDPVRRAVAGNRTAAVSPAGFERLVEQSDRDEAIQALLAERSDLPESVIAHLVAHASAEIRAKLESAGRKDEAARVDEAAGMAGERLRAEALYAGQDFGAATTRVAALAQVGLLTADTIGRFAASNRFAEAVAALAHLSGFKLADVVGWYAEREIEPVIVILRAIGGGSVDLDRVLTGGPWQHRLSAEVRDEAMRRFRALDVATARSTLARMLAQRMG